ncbi:MAG: acyltransferase family protein [Acidimicrobiia bacterium]|nr:acyltransferase family protein [Acidimicrobiia bacterium]
MSERDSQTPPTDIVGALADAMQAGMADDSVGRDPEFLTRLVPKMQTFAGYFDAEVRGLETLPADGPVMLVGNHSGGMFVPDTAAVMAKWYEVRGYDDPLIGLAFSMAYIVPQIGRFFRRVGQVPASHENARKALAAGASLLIYPGGDWEVYRPWTERNRIEFEGRKGFIRLALEAGVPVYPIVGHGGHETLIVLSRGDRLARAVGLGRLRAKILPITLGPFGPTLGFLPQIPLPAKITVQVCEPMEWDRFGPEDADDPAVLQTCYDEITQRMQAMLDTLVSENPVPLFTRATGVAGDLVRRFRSRPS